VNKPVTVNLKENPLIKYFKDTRAELRKVTWPTREEATNLTVVVLAVTFSMALILGAVDFIFAQFFRLLVGG
jgi:preprotein translocase subunit SecE